MKERSLWSLFRRQFLAHRMAVAGLLIILLLVLSALMAPVISKTLGVDPDTQNVFNRYQNFMSVTDDGAHHILGTDELGRDVLSRLLYAAQVSMGVGLSVAFIAGLIGLCVGSLAGYFGSWIDTLLMRLTDSLLSLPLIPVLIIISAIDIHKLSFLGWMITDENQNFMKLIFILCLFSWMTAARLVRGSVLSVKQNEYITAARALGASHIRIMLRHLVPNVIASLLVAVTMGIGESILFEAALSYLGMGIQPPTPSWGNMLFNSQEIIFEAPRLAILPGLMILVTVMSFNFLGDGLQQAFNPKARK